MPEQRKGPGASKRPWIIGLPRDGRFEAYFTQNYLVKKTTRWAQFGHTPAVGRPVFVRHVDRSEVIRILRILKVEKRRRLQAKARKARAAQCWRDEWRAKIRGILEMDPKPEPSEPPRASSDSPGNTEAKASIPTAGDNAQAS